MLKFDLYKILHSTTIKVWLIVSLIFPLMMPFVNRVANYSPSGIICTIYNDDNYLHYASLIFALLLGSTDTYNGYIKNIYKKVNKFYYVLSKMICIVIYSLYIYAMYFLFHIIFAFCSGLGFITENDYLFSYHIPSTVDFLRNVLTHILCLISVGSFGLFISTVIKNRALVILVALAYYFIFAGMFYEILEGFISPEIGRLVTSSNYFVVGLSELINRECAIRDVIVFSGWLVFYFISSWIIFRKRSV